jgi:transcriptional regulator with PAS, ATPase and Fis domain
MAELEDVLPRDVVGSSPATFKERLAWFERSLLEEAMREHGTTRSVAAALGLSQSSVVRKLRWLKDLGDSPTGA